MQDPLEHNPSRPVETRRNPFRLTRLNQSKHVTIRSDLLEYEGNTKIKIKIKKEYGDEGGKLGEEEEEGGGGINLIFIKYKNRK